MNIACLFLGHRWEWEIVSDAFGNYERQKCSRCGLVPSEPIWRVHIDNIFTSPTEEP